MTYKEQRDYEIKRLYATGNYSYEKLGKMFGISKTTVCHICNPEAKQRHRERVKNGKEHKPRPHRSGRII